jgi:hypothetical protein
MAPKPKNVPVTAKAQSPGQNRRGGKQGVPPDRDEGEEDRA